VVGIQRNIHLGKYCEDNKSGTVRRNERELSLFYFREKDVLEIPTMNMH
jgi:hypothetical protein